MIETQDIERTIETGIYNHVVKCVLSVVFLNCSPVNAQTNDGTTVIANPQASSTGSVTNSAVQINQGSYSTQGLGTGHFCNSGTVVFTPFYLGAGFHPSTPEVKIMALKSVLLFR